MMSSRMFVAVLAATTILAGGAALAADQAATMPPPGHGAVIKDFGKLSADGVRAYQDLTLARLAIYDGRIGDAKKLVGDAEQGFDKAKTDESVFTQAEATMRTNMTKSEKSSNMSAKSGMATTSTRPDQTAVSNDPTRSSSNDKDPGGTQTDVDKPVAWLPVDGTVSINEDYTMQPAKAKAVADANKSLAQGDRKGAMDKLKLAEVNTAVTLAVVPLQQTIGDVDQAKQLIDTGKYYEGSQKLRAVQDATVITVADMPAVPTGTNGSASAPARTTDATH